MFVPVLLSFSYSLQKWDLPSKGCMLQMSKVRVMGIMALLMYFKVDDV
jgi:hypothetical protein